MRQVERGQRRLEPGGSGRVALLGADAGQRPDEGAGQPVALGLLVGERLAADPARAVVGRGDAGGLGAQLGEEARLAEAGRTDHDDGAALAGPEGRQPIEQHPQLGAPPDQRHALLDVRLVVGLGQQDGRANRPLAAFEGQRLDALQAEPAVDPLAGPLADQDRAGRGSGLESSGDVHGIADDGVLDHPADLARSGDDLAGLDADPQAQGQAVACAPAPR